MTRTLGLLAIVCCSTLAAAQDAKAPDAATNPLSAALYSEYAIVKGYVVKAADEMPEADYSFRPTSTVRTYGQLVGHLADAQYNFCASAKGEKNPQQASIEETVTSKADLTKSLRAAFAYCDGMFTGLRDAQLKDQVPFLEGGGKQARIFIVSLNSSHDDEHYGNMVTYLRIKGLVPPSSQKPSA